MSTTQRDKNGKRIITDILTDGYLRQIIEKTYKILIPSEIRQLCFDFWFLNFCDGWDDKLSNHETVTIEGQMVKGLEDSSVRNVFGCHTISAGQYIWRLNWKKVNGAIGIGIIHDYKVEYSLNDIHFATNGFGICLDLKTGYSYNDTSSCYTVFAKPVAYGIENVGIEVRIDLDERCIYFSINGDEEKKAPYTLKQGKSFRLILAFGTDGAAEVELL